MNTDIGKKLTKWIKEKLDTGNKKKLVENIIIVIIIGIIIIIAGGAFFTKKSSATNSGNSGKTVEETSKTTVVNKSEDEIDEESLENILSKVKGVGRADVMITYSASEEIVPAYDSKNNKSDTTEKDGGGGTRNVSESDTEESIAYRQDQAGEKQPIVLKSIEPEVRGVLVVADGAADPEIKEKISAAVQTLMNVPAHKIQVFERKK